MKKTTFTELIFRGFLLFAIFTVVQEQPGFDAINRIWLAIVSLAIFFRLMQYSYTLKELVVLVATVLIHAIAIYFTEFPMVHTNMLFYFLLWIALYLFFAKSKDKILSSMESSETYIDGVLWIWTILVGISAFLPSSYKGRYFVSFASSSFRFMPTTLIIMALAMYRAINSGNSRYYWFMALPTYAALMNESRTYFAVYFCFLLMFVYMQMKSKKVFYALVIPMGAVFLLLMSASGIMDKLEAVQYKDTSYFDYWGTITSGRSVFWEMDLEAFFALPFWQQFVGNGFNFVYEVNAAGFAEIWAHNDIINLLMNFGYIGVAIYLWIFFKMTKTFFGKDGKIPLLVKILFFFAVFFNSMMNMSYTYMCAMISYPLILCAISRKYQNLSEKQCNAKIGERPWI